MTFETKVDFKDYVRLMFVLTYRRPGMIVASILGLLLFAFCILYIIGIVQSVEFPWLPFIYSLIIVLGMPLFVYYSADKNYKTYARLQERITYDISGDLIVMTGESFVTQMTWGKTYKVLELKDWLLLYQNKFVANIIPKSLVGNQIHELREIIKSQNVKQRLKTS